MPRYTISESDLETQHLTDTMCLPFADNEFKVIGQGNQPALAAHGAHLANVVHIHNGIAVNAAEYGILQSSLQFGERVHRLIFFCCW
jgi:hypothetical protein